MWRFPKQRRTQKAFESFIFELGASLHNGVLVDESLEGHGYGLFASSDVKKGSTLVEVPAPAYFPYSAAAALENAKANATVYKAIGTVAANRENFVQSIAMTINQMMLKEGSDPYMALLFEQANEGCGHILYAADDDVRLKALQGTTALHELLKRKRLFSSFGSLLGDDPAVRTRFLTSMSLITSRGISGSGVPLTLCPVLDFVNHAQEPNASYSVQKQDMRFVLTAERHIAAGQEICISYGRRSASSFMSLYSFYPGPSPADFVRVPHSGASGSGDVLMIDSVLHEGSAQRWALGLPHDTLSSALDTVEAGIEARVHSRPLAAPQNANAATRLWLEAAAQLVGREVRTLEHCRTSLLSRFGGE